VKEVEGISESLARAEQLGAYNKLECTQTWHHSVSGTGRVADGDDKKQPKSKVREEGGQRERNKP